ncbi:hypothetical protein [Burkholderia gladioli]|uniref:hypothetical protein n=1 Tax=Burkholderia gladioli TaxID=28095 RepID=UPI001FC8265A|nr:hypothetical protein [Burkholderia gladioli]
MTVLLVVLRPDDNDVTVLLVVLKPDDNDVTLLLVVLKPDDNDVTLLLVVLKPDDSDVTVLLVVLRPDDSDVTLLLVVLKPDDSDVTLLLVVLKPDDNDVTLLLVVLNPLDNDVTSPLTALCASAFSNCDLVTASLFAVPSARSVIFPPFTETPALPPVSSMPFLPNEIFLSSLFSSMLFPSSEISPLRLSSWSFVGPEIRIVPFWNVILFDCPGTAPAEGARSNEISPITMTAGSLPDSSGAVPAFDSSR